MIAHRIITPLNRIIPRQLLYFDLGLVGALTMAGLVLYRPGKIWYHTYFSQVENQVVRSESLATLVQMGKSGHKAMAYVAVKAKDSEARTEAKDLENLKLEAG